APAADRHDAAGARPARDPVAGQREPVQRRVPGGRPAPRGERPAAVAGVVRGRRSGRRVARRLRVGLRRADRRLLRPVRVLQDRLPPLAFGPPYERRRARSAYVPRRRGGERMNARPIRWSAILSAGALIVASCGGTSVGPSASPTVAAVATTAAPTQSPSSTPSATLASGAPTPQPTLLPPVAADTTVVSLTKIPIPPLSGKTASIDIIQIDQAAHRLYVADRTTNGVDVFDISTKDAKYLKSVDAGSGANGVVVAKDVNKLFAGLNDSNVAIIDLTSLTVIAKVNTGGKGRADELDYDPKDKKVYVANSGDGFVTVI